MVSRDPADEIHVGWSRRGGRGGGGTRRRRTVHNKTQQLGINQTRLEGQQEAALSCSPEEWTSASCCGCCASSSCSPQNNIIHLECVKSNKQQKPTMAAHVESTRGSGSSQQTLQPLCSETQVLKTRNPDSSQRVSVCVCVSVSAGSPL